MRLVAISRPFPKKTNPLALFQFFTNIKPLIDFPAEGFLAQVTA